MQLQLSKIVTELGVLGTIGIGVLLLKNKPKTQSDEYSQYDMLCRTGFTHILDKFKILKQDDAFDELCLFLNHYLKISDDLSKGKEVVGGQFLMNRMCEEINVRSKLMIYNARSSRDSDVLTACIHCEQDELELLNSACQDILRNMLLSQ